MNISIERSQRVQLIAICAAFFILGVSIATWASRIPAIRTLAELTPLTLGYALLAKGIGTIVIIPMVTHIIQKVGAKATSLLFGIIMIIMLAGAVASRDWIMLSLAMFAWGAGISGFNISVNALGSKLEVLMEKSYMSTLHSWFGIGNFAGAILGTWLSSKGVNAPIHFVSISAFLLLAMIILYRFLPMDESHLEPPQTFFKIPHGGLVWLGLICFLAASIEDSISNWVTLYFTDHVDIHNSLASIGYAAYAGALLLMRLIGDRLKPKYGANNLIGIGAAVGAIGLVVSILSINSIIVTLGFIAAGAGIALAFPMAFSAAGREGPVAIASVATMGYLGGMLSQPTMGFLVETISLSGGFVFVVICMLLITVSTQKAKLLRT